MMATIMRAAVTIVIEVIKIPVLDDSGESDRKGGEL